MFVDFGFPENDLNGLKVTNILLFYSHAHYNFDDKSLRYLFLFEQYKVTFIAPYLFLLLPWLFSALKTFSLVVIISFSYHRNDFKCLWLDLWILSSTL